MPTHDRTTYIFRPAIIVATIVVTVILAGVAQPSRADTDVFATSRRAGKVMSGSPIVTPNQLPEVFNKLQQLHIDGRYRLTKNLAASLSYLYEPLKIYDYAFDPSVVNGIAQPSSLVLGYVTRPYTAHSFNFGIRYFW